MQVVVIIMLSIAALIGCAAPTTTGQTGVTGSVGATGVAGTSCTVTQNVLGALIVCPDGTSSLVLHGTTGPRTKRGKQ